MKNADKRFGFVSVPYLMRKFKITHKEAIELVEKFKKAKLVK